jgi:hypothetical protein
VLVPSTTCGNAIVAALHETNQRAKTNTRSTISTTFGAKITIDDILGATLGASSTLSKQHLCQINRWGNEPTLQELSAVPLIDKLSNVSTVLWREGLYTII